MKMVFEFYFMKKEGFVEKDFLGVISKNLTQLGIVTSFKYQAIVEGYLFEIEYKEVLPGFTYQSIMGCFSGLWQEYPYISNISIPMEKIRLN